MAVTTTPGAELSGGRWPSRRHPQHAAMRRSTRFLACCLLIAGAALASGCDAGREENNPFGGIDHNYRHVGQVDPIPNNGR